MRKTDEMLTRLASVLDPQAHGLPRDYSEERLRAALGESADVLDDFDLHNHCLQSQVDAGWFLLRDLLNAAHDRIGEDPVIKSGGI